MPQGIRAVFLDGTDELRSEPVDLDTDPGKLVNEWLELLDSQTPS